MKQNKKTKSEINQLVFRTGCAGFAVVCDNVAVNFANIDQDNDATQGNANIQIQSDNFNLALAALEILKPVKHKKQN